MRAILSKKMQVGNRGFSLIELMVVVAIIGILATLAIPSVQGFISRARQSEARTNLSQAFTVVKAYGIDPANTIWPAVGNGILAMGYRPEGPIRYNTGFTGTSGLENSKRICGASPVPAGINCSLVSNPPNLGTFATAVDWNGGSPSTDTAWVLGSTGNIGGSVADEWSMTSGKVLTNRTQGL